MASAKRLDQQCLYLFDDLVSELDDTHQQKLIDYLARQQGQYVITSVNKMDLIDQLPREHVFSYAINNGLVVTNSSD